MTGALTSCLASRSSSLSCQLSVWDKGGGAGGRMATTRWTGNGKQVSADLGAQYFSAKEQDQIAHK